MPNGRYRFKRNNSSNGFFSKNTPSTDAINVLSNWSNAQPKRKYSILSDADEMLVAELSWGEFDITVGSDMDDSCLKFGVERSYEKL